jgi:hypothetical protein
MPRANRHFLPGYVWQIIHLCSSPFHTFHHKVPFQLFQSCEDLKPNVRTPESRSMLVGSGRGRRFEFC